MQHRQGKRKMAKVTLEKRLVFMVFMVLFSLGGGVRANATEIIVDNPDATFTGTWGTYPANSETYGDDMRISSCGGVTATWTANIDQDGTYEVYSWWNGHSNRATNAPYDVKHANGSSEVRVDQRSNGGQWNLLGTYEFIEGTYDVVLGRSGVALDEYVVADAIKWEQVSAGDLYTISGQITENSVGVNGIRVELTGVTPTGRTDYYVTSGGGNYSFEVPDGTYTVTPNEESYPCNPTSIGSIVVDGADKTNQNFTTSWIPTIIIDNPDATFTGSWGTYPANCQTYGDDMRIVGAGSGGRTATWTANIVEAGTYDVYAWWVEHSNRGTNLTYIVDWDGDPETTEDQDVVYPVDQQSDGGTWVLLAGDQYVDANTSVYVELSDDANGYVVVDAIKIVKQ